MNPEIEDPNNHVPVVAPDDAWDDLGDLADGPQPGLPPKRLDQGLPPKKESRSPRVTLLTPMAKPERETQYDPGRSTGDESGSDGENHAVQGQPATPAKSPRKAKRKHSAELGDPSPSSETEPAKPEELQEGRYAIPEAQPAKRLKVYEIGLASQAPAPRPEKMTIAKVSGDLSGDANSSPQKKRRRHFHGEQSGWGDNDQSGSLKWMLFTGLGVLLLVIVAVALSQLFGRGDARDEELPVFGELVQVDEESEEGNASLKDLETLTNSADKAKAIIAAYAAAKKPGDLVDLLHAPERNAEVLEAKWKPLPAKPGWAPGDESLWTVIDQSGTRLGILDCTLPDFTNFKAFFRQEEGGLKLDWRATVGYGTADFTEMKSGKGDGSEVRAVVSPADFFTYSFPEDKFRCYRIMSPDGNVNIWGYVPIDGELDQELLKPFLPSPVTGESRSECQLTLSLETGDGDSLPDQWIITGIKRQDWLDE